MLDWSPSALPMFCGAYGLELVSVDAEGVRLKFFGLERFRGEAERPAFVVETGFAQTEADFLAVLRKRYA
jgi:hypothetical protein